MNVKSGCSFEESPASDVDPKEIHLSTGAVRLSERISDGLEVFDKGVILVVLK